MEYNRVTAPVIAELKSIVGSQNVLDDPEQMLSYSHDEATGAKWRHLPEVVVKPQNTQQISAILKLANQERIPVTPRGAGSGLAAGAVPFLGGILLTLEKMNRIIELDRDNMFMVVEPGVTTAEVQQCAREAGLFYAGDPCSADSSFIGGNVATNAGGNKAIRYGVTGQHVFGLEVVLADGQVAVLGGKTIKEVSGYNLIQLMIGSEGTLGVITKIYLKLQPRPQFNGVIMAPFASIPAAIQLVPEMITKSGIIPTSIEFMDNLCIKAAEQFLNKQLMFNHAAAYIIIELDGNSEGQLLAEMEMLAEQCYRNNALDVLVGDNAATQERIWKPRRVLAEALRVISPVYSMEDIVVPIKEIPAVVLAINSLSEKYGIRIANFGHAGDGNIHATLLKDQLGHQEWDERKDQLLDELYAEVYRRGGKISGEHGIGAKRKEALTQYIDPVALQTMKTIKRALDPNGILNPGKIFNL
ncbi:MAG TPA: FAD-binding oxidoreductase [Syntrophomonas sp.]|nr:FAD-binding oxidoreductase [Syntrophomonas sp.]